jgi:sulfite exporter TauE/SafE/copper chaperone CopZ
MRTLKLSIGDLHCQGCETIVEQAVTRLPGVEKAKADYDAGTLDVTFDPAQTDPAPIAAAVEAAGYSCSPQRPARSPSNILGRLLLVLLALAGIVGLLAGGGSLAERFQLPHLEHEMSYGLLFLVGLFTGFHCVGMCGGFVLGYATRSAAASGRTQWPTHLLYGLGKTLSYTLIGGGFGLLGSVIAFTPQNRGYAAIAAGAFLILFGINMLDWFPGLRRFGLRMPRFLVRCVSAESQKHSGPFSIGLLNGLMIACGPLQAMYVMAAGTGGFLEGARMLLAFGLGTLPVMLVFGMLAGAVSSRISHGLLKASALLVAALGLIMLNRGLLLAGTGYDFRSLAALAERRLETLQATSAESREDGRQTIRMEVDGQGYHPNRFILKQGVPVEWTVVGQEITQCNRRIMVPALDLEFEVRPGESVIEFTPERAGVIGWSCWMGMLHGAFVVEPADGGEPSAVPTDAGEGARFLRRFLGRVLGRT